MKKPARRNVVCVIAVLALLIAATTGAAVRYTIRTIASNDFALLDGTNVYCFNNPQADVPSTFVCVDHVVTGGRFPRKGAYGIVISRREVTVTHWTGARDQNTPVRVFRNP